MNPTKYAVYNSAPPGKNPKSNVGDLDATPLEWMLNGRMFFTAKRQVYAGLGAGTRLTGGFAPDFRAVAVVGGSFGTSDHRRRCPVIPSSPARLRGAAPRRPALFRRPCARTRFMDASSEGPRRAAPRRELLTDAGVPPRVGPQLPQARASARRPSFPANRCQPMSAWRSRPGPKR